MLPVSAKMTHVCIPPAATAETETVVEVDTDTWSRFCMEAAFLPAGVHIAHERVNERASSFTKIEGCQT